VSALGLRARLLIALLRKRQYQFNILLLQVAAADQIMAAAVLVVTFQHLLLQPAQPFTTSLLAAAGLAGHKALTERTVRFSLQPQ
jgi:hypothetical protein